MLEYAGPKPHIFHTGIDFDQNKEDKYVYLHIVVELIRAVSHEYVEDRVYTYTTADTQVNGRQLMNELKLVCPDLTELIKHENIDVEEEIKEDIERARENKMLTEEEKITLENNIKIMHDYLIQRAINKEVYYCAINVLAEQLKRDHIDYVIVPMYPKFVHVLHSVQGVLRKEKFPIDTKIDIYKQDDKLLAKLQVITL